LPLLDCGFKFSLVFDRSPNAAGKRRLVLIFIGTLAVGLAGGIVALREMGGTSNTVEAVLSEHAQSVLEVERLNTLSERLGRVARSYLLTGEARFLAELQAARQAFSGTATLLASRMDNPEGRRILALVRRLEDEHELAVDRAVTAQSLHRSSTDAVASLEREVRPTREQLDLAMEALSQSERRDFDLARSETTARAQKSVRLLIAVSAISVVLAAVLAWLLSRTLSGLERSRRALDASLAKLERANRDLDAFAGRIAHDLRNILAPLPLNAARLRRGSASREIVEASADRIERIARRAEGLIEALLAFARAGQPPDAAASASVRRAVAAAVDDAADLRALVDAEVSLDIDDVEVRVADSLLYTVVANLLTNALKFLEGRPARRVNVSARTTGGSCELVVQDTGPGIPLEAQSRIFQPFFRAPDAKGRGTGIGLATVQRIVEAYGGRVTVRSSPDQGAAFVIRLPLADPGARPALAHVPAEAPVIH
jgi:two-component system OmpR family sensor kinase